MSTDLSSRPGVKLLNQHQVAIAAAANRAIAANHHPKDFLLICLSLDDPDYLPVADELAKDHGFTYSELGESPPVILGALSIPKAIEIFGSPVTNALRMLQGPVTARTFRAFVITGETTALCLIKQETDHESN